MQIRPLCEYYARGNTPLEGERKVLEGMLYFYPYLTRLIAYLATACLMDSMATKAMSSTCRRTSPHLSVAF